MSGDHNMNKIETKPNPPLYSGDFVKGVMAERQRIVNLLMIQHEAANGAHNYWQVAAQLIQADVAADGFDRQWAMEMAAAVRARSNK